MASVRGGACLSDWSNCDRHAISLSLSQAHISATGGWLGRMLTHKFCRWFWQFNRVVYVRKNPNIEIRNPKQYPKSECSKFKTNFAPIPFAVCLGHSYLGHLILFRASIFEFRIWASLTKTGRIWVLFPNFKLPFLGTAFMRRGSRCPIADRIKRYL